jgi:23S rRNA pseudouridine1911/1915/1917 synthase
MSIARGRNPLRSAPPSGGCSPVANQPGFSVIEETDDWIVVDKPAPLKIHPSVPDGLPTLYDLLRDLLAYELANGGQVSIINRLDRETSGVVLVAKTAAAARRFGIAMQQRRFHKTYLAVAHGWPDWEEREVGEPLLRQSLVRPSVIRVKQMAHSAGAESLTRFRVLARTSAAFGPVSVLEAHPVTGRMHQIRVHAAWLGHPLVGDKIYGPDETCYLDFIESGWTPALAARLHVPRHMLHAARLEIDLDGESRHWSAPPPADWSAVTA